MNKSTNNYRKCQYCPHHMQQKKQCCCQNRTNSIKTKPNSRGKNTKNKNRNHSKSNNAIDSSSISYINTTLPVANTSPFVPAYNNYSGYNTTMLAQNSILRTQNDYLKRELQTNHHLHPFPSLTISSFTKQDTKYPNSCSTHTTCNNCNISTSLPTSQNQTARTHILHDKLYLSNRNLQQTIIQLDSISKMNKQLNEYNVRLMREKQQLRIRNQELYEQCVGLKKKIKKISRDAVNESDLEKLVEMNDKMGRENRGLREQILGLKEQLDQQRRSKNKSRIVEDSGLSPEWVAHTSSKINVIQKNLSKLQQQQKQNIGINMNSCYHSTTNSRQLCKNPQQDPLCIKPQLISTIKLLKLHYQPYKPNTNSSMFQYQQFTNTSYNSYNSNINNNCSLLLLIKMLCQSLMQPILVLWMQKQKQIEKNIKIYQSRFNNIVYKLKNFMMKMNNQKLKSRNGEINGRFMGSLEHF